MFTMQEKFKSCHTIPGIQYDLSFRGKPNMLESYDLTIVFTIIWKPGLHPSIYVIAMQS